MKNYDEWHQRNTVYKYFILTPNSDINFEENLKIKCGDTEFTFTLQSLGILDEFVIDYFKEIIRIYQNNLEEFLTKHSKILSNDISIFQLQFNSKNNNLLTKSLTNIEMDSIFKNELREKLGKKAEIAALKNSFQFIIGPLIESINNYFIELYNQGMDRKKFIEFAINTIKVSFDEIGKKLNNIINHWKN